MKNSLLVESPGGPHEGEVSARRAVGIPLVWLNLVCLDAPLVAVSWLWIFSSTFGIPIARGGTAALFLTAWFIYLADRFGDSLSIDERGPTSMRQRICLRYRRAWMAAFGLIALADLVVICARLDSVTRWSGLAAGMVALGYLVLNQALPALWRRVPLKEICIGCLFAAGTVVPLVAGITNVAWPGWLLFAFLCSLNCICIAVWEEELDQAQRRISIATEFQAIRRFLFPALLVLTGTSSTMGFLLAESRPVLFCVAGSSLLLLTAHWFQKWIPCDTRTAIADLVLLTPLILWALRGF
ncbi:MAG: hypothetical protein ABI946_08355 [Chthoniobacterales bacterium]